MKRHPQPSLRRRCQSYRAQLLAALCSLTSLASHGGTAVPLLDDYSDPIRNSRGVQRLVVDDKAAGSHSRVTHRCGNGVLNVEGELVPGRGVPAFVSVVSMLSADGKSQDMTGCEGVRLRVKVLKGMLCVQVSSSTVTNFDYHTGSPIAGQGREFQEVRIPFKTLKRTWSEQTPLNLRAITSVNLVSFGLARDTFAYEVKELGFY